MRQLSGITKLLVMVLFVLAGIAFIVFVIIVIRQDNNWPETTGTIQSMELIHEAVDSEDTDTWEVMVEFQVDGKTYVSDLGQYQDDFEVGKEIAIRYNPEAPEAIVLPGKGLSIMAIIAGVVCVIGGALGFIKALLVG